jgi:EpsD family peptidyl-prolyl cis-trans isomerase
MKQTGKLLLLAAALSLPLAACNDKKAAAPGAAKVAVKVNGQAINLSELDIKSGNVAGQAKHAVSDQVIKRLVDMELMRQAAEQAKLDKDENIHARLAIAKRTILATAYMEKQLASIGKPNGDEISAFYNQNPARFSARKQYAIHEFSLQAPPGKAEEIQSQAAKGKTVQAFEQWLTQNQIPHNSTPVTVTSYRLPDDVLQKLGKLTVGGNMALIGKDQMNVIFVLGEKSEPLALAQVEPMIASMLVEKRKAETLERMVKDLRDKAKIEYVPPVTANGLPLAE